MWNNSCSWPGAGEHCRKPCSVSRASINSVTTTETGLLLRVAEQESQHAH
ncbi:hypothetical protein [Arthrobacter sp. AFG20]|nr:hypothetical protein [Arthrobacter sp. AFG20]